MSYYLIKDLNNIVATYSNIEIDGNNIKCKCDICDKYKEEKMYQKSGSYINKNCGYIISTFDLQYMMMKKCYVM